MENDIDPSNEVAGLSDWKSILGPILQSPDSSALFFDIDGTLAPIMPSPDDVVLPRDAGKALTSLASKYKLVACVSGRNAAVAKKIVGLDGITYIGCHGLERIRAGSDEVETSAEVEKYAPAVNSFIRGHFTEELREVGVSLEDKGSIQVFLWRRAENQTLAEQRLNKVAQSAIEAGLCAQWGRKVLEIRPPVDVNKGTALVTLLHNSPIELALYAGDDRTDLDAFKALRTLVSEGRLVRAVCVGVSSSEGPEEMPDMADIVVDGTADIAKLLDLLATDKSD